MRSDNDKGDSWRYRISSWKDLGASFRGRWYGTGVNGVDRSCGIGERLLEQGQVVVRIGLNDPQL